MGPVTSVPVAVATLCTFIQNVKVNEVFVMPADMGRPPAGQVAEYAPV